MFFKDNWNRELKKSFNGEAGRKIKLHRDKIVFHVNTGVV
jgi:hypothetical protein